MKKHKWGYLYCLLAGVCDASTGLLLMAAPIFTLKLMRIPQLPVEPIYMRWIGAMVMCWGLAYLYPLTFKDEKLRLPRARVVIEFTLIVRVIIGVFASLAVVSHALPREWISVGFTDLTFAVIQGIMLSKGWFKPDNV